MDLWATDGRDVYHDEIFQSSAAREPDDFDRLRNASAGESRDGIFDKWEHGGIYDEWYDGDRLYRQWRWYHNPRHGNCDRSWRFFRKIEYYNRNDPILCDEYRK